MKTEVRCPKCGKKACEAAGDRYEITVVCGRCKTKFTHVNEDMLKTETQ